MISTRHALNPQAQAISGIASRYETPVSAFTTRPAMRSVSDLVAKREPTPTQSKPTMQPVEAPSTLSAIASGVSGGEAPQPIGSYAPMNDFEAEVDKAVFGTGTGFVKDRAVSGVVNAAMAKLAGAPGDAVLEAGVQGAVPGLGSLAKLAADLATRSVAKSQIMDSYGPHMQDFSMESYDTYQDTAPFEKAGEEMAVDDSVGIPGSTSVEDKAQFGLRDAMVADAQDRTRGIATQTISELADRVGLIDPQRTIYDEVVLPEEILRRMQYGTSAPAGVVDRGLERDFASMLDEGAVRDYADYGIDVRSDLPYSPVDPETMAPIGNAVPSQAYLDELDAKFGDVFGDIFGGGESSSVGVGSTGGGRAASDMDMSGDTDAGGLGGFGMW